MLYVCNDVNVCVVIECTSSAGGPMVLLYISSISISISISSGACSTCVGM